MKKNKMCRLASALLILVLLTTSIVGSTFAKYTTEGTASDTARVAKWGVTVNTSGSLYSDAYAIENAADGKGNLPTQWSATPAADAITVASKTAKDNIVAPGTKSADGGLSFSISGTPEVAVKVTTEFSAEDIYLKQGNYGVLVKANVTDDASLKELITDKTYVYKFATGIYTKLAADAAAFATGDVYYYLTTVAEVGADGYFPVKYKLADATSIKAQGKAITVAQMLATEVGAPIETDKEDYAIKYTAEHTYAANTDLGADGPHFSQEKLSWEWAFEEGTGDTDKAKNNAADTVLGNLIALKNDSTIDTYKVVSVNTGDYSVSPLTISTDDFTVSDSTNTVVANLQTKFDITLTVTQID